MTRRVLCVGGLVVLAAGCTGKAPDAESGPALVFTVDADWVVAGEVLSWSAQVRYPDGIAHAAAVEVVSDRESDLAFSGVYLYPRVAGSHRLVARARVDGVALMDVVEVEVVPGPATTLDLRLEPAHISAGEAAAVVADIADGFGNAIDPAGLELIGADQLSVTDMQVSATAAGVWALAASIDGLSETTSLTVDPNAPDHVDLSLAVFDASARADVQVTDAFDNPVFVPTVLEVAGIESYWTSGPVLFFLEEGTATVRACVADAAPEVCSAWVSADLDWTPPELTVDTPARGSWWSADPIELSGTTTDLEGGTLTVTTLHAGAETLDALVPGPTGDFSLSLAPLTHGMVVAETVALDGRGRRSRDLRTVLVGDVVALDARQSDGLLIRLDEDPAGLGLVEALAEREVDEVDLASEVPNPVYDERDRQCVPTGLGSQICIVNSLELSVTDLTYSDREITLDGQSDGTLDGTMVWTDFTVDWQANGKVNDANYTETGTGTADALEMAFRLSFAVDGEQVEVTATDVTVSLVDFEVGESSDIVAVSGVLGVDVDQLVGGAVSDAAAEVLPPVIEQAVEEALFGLNLDVGWDRGAALRARPTGVVVDGNGLELSFGSTANVSTVVLDLDPTLAHGALTDERGLPEWDGDPHPASMALSYTLLNQVFHANWASGLVEREGDAELFQIDPAVFTAVLPGITDLVGTLSATYPPVFVPNGEGGALLELAEVRLDFYDLEVIEGTEVYTIFISSSTPVTFALAGNRLDLQLGAQDVWMDVAQAPAEADLFFLEVLLETFTAGLVLDEYELVDALPLPTIDGSELQGEVVTVQGPDDAYVVIDGGFDVD